MTKKVGFWLILGAILVISGILGFTVLMGSLGWDFAKLGNSDYETNTHEVDADFINIRIDVDTANVAFLPSEDGKCKVVCHEDPDERHLVSVEGDTLSIASPKGVKVHINWLNFDQQKITVYLPKSEYTSLSVETDTGYVDISADFLFEKIDVDVDTGNVNIWSSAKSHINVESNTGRVLLNSLSAASIMVNCDTGDVSVSDISAGYVVLETETGKISVSKLDCSGDLKIGVDTGDSSVNYTSCKNFYSNGDTGDIDIHGFIASEKITIERDTGDVRFSGMDAAEIYIDTDTGRIAGSLLSGKMFTANTNTGRIRIPDDTEGGICKLTTNTGDIEVTVEN